MLKSILKQIWPALIWSVTIFVLLIIPGKELPSGPELPNVDKIIHVILFGGQVWLWSNYVKYKTTLPRSKWIFLLIFILSSLYGIGMEYIQKYFVVNRGFEIGDIVADILGSAVAFLIFKKQQV